eukprot:gnl/TRDRNA2_/TRDRNA2_178804_c0_seq1.p1 gnl/TRDRNA2_/TRDRNA2_178804_c0~~gnl/TRDRNA2_/TRDRNA2_178804_c0_seq1.p1  ORF type:complete len:290 (+),score=19.32 gnl/TRDRNA2_/TRDRNA2_178804_c0_seq1:110-979(+)
MSIGACEVQPNAYHGFYGTNAGMTCSPETCLSWGGAPLPRIETIDPRICDSYMHRIYIPRLGECVQPKMRKAAVARMQEAVEASRRGSSTDPHAPASSHGPHAHRSSHDPRTRAGRRQGGHSSHDAGNDCSRSGRDRSYDSNSNQGYDVRDRGRGFGYSGSSDLEYGRGQSRGLRRCSTDGFADPRLYFSSGIPRERSRRPHSAGGVSEKSRRPSSREHWRPSAATIRVPSAGRTPRLKRSSSAAALGDRPVSRRADAAGVTDAAAVSRKVVPPAGKRSSVAWQAALGA